MSEQKKVASLRNKLTPFWNLVALLSEDANIKQLQEIKELTQKELLNCKRNIPIIENLLKEME